MKMENIVTSEFIAGRKVTKTLGAVKGSTVRARHIGSNIMAGIRDIIGGEVRGYAKMIGDARDEAENRMIEEADALGADAIISTRYTTSQITDGAAEILVYGTAVKLDK